MFSVLLDENHAMKCGMQTAADCDLDVEEVQITGWRNGILQNEKYHEIHLLLSI